MSYGVYIKGRTPKSKKQIKEAMRDDPASVTFYDTSFFNPGPTFDGANVPPSTNLTFVGPNPYQDRKFYGTVKVRDGKVVVG